MSAIITATNQLAVYSNVVLRLLVPEIAHFAEKAGLPEKQCSVSDVRRFSQEEAGQPEGYLTFKNGNRYSFFYGYVQNFESPRSYYGLQRPELIPSFYGTPTITPSEAVTIARKLITDLGYSLEDLYADLTPEVLLPRHVGTNIVPYYRVRWPCPNRDTTSARVEINGATKTIEGIWFLNDNLRREPPTPPLNGYSNLSGQAYPALSPEAGAALFRKLLPLISKYCERLSLPAALPLSSNSVSSYSFRDPGWPFGHIVLTNGITFRVLGTNVIGFAKDAFFLTEHAELRVREFVASWEIGDDEAIDAARRILRKLGLPDAATAYSPSITKPFGAARQIVPRAFLLWNKPEANLPSIQVEVDYHSGTIIALRVL